METNMYDEICSLIEYFSFFDHYLQERQGFKVPQELVECITEDLCILAYRLNRDETIYDEFHDLMFTNTLLQERQGLERDKEQFKKIKDDLRELAVSLR